MAAVSVKRSLLSRLPHYLKAWNRLHRNSSLLAASEPEKRGLKSEHDTSTFPIRPYLPPKILHNLCFSFLLGFTAVTRKIESSNYAKFGGQITCIMGMWKRRIRVLALSVWRTKKISSWLVNGLHKMWKDLCKFLSVQKYVLTRVNGIFKWVFSFLQFFFLLRCGSDGKNKYTRHTRNGLLYQQFF